MRLLLTFILISVIAVPAFSAIELHDGVYRYNSASPQYYKFQQGTAFWGVVGVRPLPGNDWDLYLYSDTNFINSLECSMSGENYTDYIAIDFNSGCASLGWYGVIIDRYSGTGGCRIEDENGADAIPTPGTTGSIPWEPSHVVKIWNIYLANGEEFTFSLDITAGLIDLGMALFQPSEANCFQDRSEAVWRCDDLQGGGNEQYTYTAAISGQYGFIVWCKNDEAGIYDIKIQAPCGKPALSSPYNGLQDIHLPINLCWNPVPGADKYQLQIDDNPDFLLPAIIETTYDCYSTDDLDLCTTYWWRVRASCDNGVTWGEWSEKWSFMTCCRLDPPEIVFPSIGAAHISRCPRFDWNDLPGALQYEIQVSLNPFLNSNYEIWEIVYSSYYNVPDNQKLTPITPYFWRVRGYDNCGSGNWPSGLWDFTTDELSSVEEIDSPQLPEHFALSQNYPNPFNPETSIEFDLPRTSLVTIDVYNIVGRHIRNLANERLSAGRKVVTWDGRDDYGQSVSSGVYFYRIATGEYSATRKMTLLK